MEFDKALQIVDKHAREYIVSLIGVFRRNYANENDADFLDPDNKILIFGTLSAVLGILLIHYGLYRTLPDADFYTEYILKQFSYWLALSFVLYLALRAARQPVGLQDCITAVFRIMPAAYVIGGFAGFVANDVAKLWSEPDLTWRSAYRVIIVAQLSVVLLYTPGSVSRIPRIGRIGTAIGSALVFCVVLFVQLLHWVENSRP